MAECSTASTLRSWPFPLQSCISTPCNCLPDSPSVYHEYSEWRESSRCIFAFKRRLSTSHAAMQTTSWRHANGPARCLNDFALQSQPFCNAISAILAPNMAGIVRQYGRSKFSYVFFLFHSMQIYKIMQANARLFRIYFCKSFRGSQEA